tara:strand:- start:1282 stop:2244 length:963 start_codon:yes stop_codon:yes gene_type:complete
MFLLDGSDRINGAPQRFADKLRLIMRVTGCETQKALYTKLKASNPDTSYDPVRAYKWIQGRASPRNHSVYDDLARLLGLSVGGEELRTCSYEAFCTQLTELYGDQMPDLQISENTVSKEPDGGPVYPASQLPEYLAGRYLSISRAWSPHRPGMLICGISTVCRDGVGGLELEYAEHLPWGELKVTGQMQRVGRNMIAPLTDMDAEMAIIFTYVIPPAPGAVLAGVMSGVTMSDTEMRPVACRILSLRIPDDSMLQEDPSGYFEVTADEVAARLTCCGMTLEQGAGLVPDILDFLLDPGDRGVIEASIATINNMIGKMLAR